MPVSLKNWKKQFLENMSKDEIEMLQKDNDALAMKVGKLTIEKDFLEGKLASLVSSKEHKALLNTKLNISLNKQ